MSFLNYSRHKIKWKGPTGQTLSSLYRDFLSIQEPKNSYSWCSWWCTWWSSWGTALWSSSLSWIPAFTPLCTSFSVTFPFLTFCTHPPLSPQQWYTSYQRKKTSPSLDVLFRCLSPSPWLLLFQILPGSWCLVAVLNNYLSIYHSALMHQPSGPVENGKRISFYICGIPWTDNQGVDSQGKWDLFAGSVLR